MVSTITSRLLPTYDIWDVLAGVLPAGSMTGAPKKRSVEILSQIEKSSRGIYSGVLGWGDVNGNGEWNVIIRTAVISKNSTASKSFSFFFFLK